MNSGAKSVGRFGAPELPRHIRVVVTPLRCCYSPALCYKLVELTEPQMVNIILPPIDRTLYPELDLILWDTAERVVSANNVFSAYEKRWRYVDQTRLIPRERKLITDLIHHLGNGLFLAA